MIVNNTYFRNEIYIPHAKPSIAESVAGIGSNISDFIHKYEAGCLKLCLGPLYFDLFKNLDKNEDSLIKEGADSKWDDLVNGKTYICPRTGEKRVWNGIRFKDPHSDYYRSFIAYYIYFYYERNDFETKTTTGTQMEIPSNARPVIPTNKLVNSWNNFVELVAGRLHAPNVYNKGGIIGLDYYSSNNDWLVSLYQFINDSNYEDEVYAGFKPKAWDGINVFGL